MGRLASQPNGINGRDEGMASLLEDLHALHADEFAYLSKRLTNFERKSEESWIFRSYAIVGQYFIFISRTWTKAAWAFVFFPTSELPRASGVTAVG